MLERGGDPMSGRAAPAGERPDATRPRVQAAAAPHGKLYSDGGAWTVEDDENCERLVGQVPTSRKNGNIARTARPGAGVASPQTFK